MNDSIRNKIVDVLPVGLMTLVLITLGFGPGPAAPAPQDMQSMPGIEVILLHDDRYVPYHVPPPEQAVLGIQAATFSVNWNPGSCSGTISPWPAEAQTAFNYAIGIWASLLNSSQTIEVDACWRSDLGADVLGSAGPTYFYRNFPNAPVANTWYPVALANALADSDLEAGAEIEANFSSTFNWYYGTDGNTPPTQVDFASVVLHELGHGLGFIGSMLVDDGSESSECNGTTGYGCWGWGTGYPFIYDRFTEDGNSTSLLNTGTYPNPSAALGNPLTGNVGGGVYFDGTNANAANGGARVKLYSPSTWKPGSSYSHLDEIFNGTPNALMTYSLANGELEHSPGPVTLGMFQDMGWSVSNVGPLMYDSHTVDDDTSGGSDGNNDGIVNCGETIELPVDLYNQGNDTATGVSAVLSTGDSYISIADSQENYPDIPGGATRTCDYDFDFEVDPSTPNGHVIHFDLDITASNGGPWADSFDVPVICVQRCFYDGFESGSLGAAWTTYTTNDGRVQVSSDYPYAGTYSVLLDDSVISGYSYAAAIVTTDLSGRSQVDLDFWWREFGDENHSGDGVFISDDNGANWYQALSFNDGPSSYRNDVIDIDAAAAANGLTLNDHFQIKFQFYDDWPITSDGYAIDEMELLCASQPNIYLPIIQKNSP